MHHETARRGDVDIVLIIDDELCGGPDVRRKLAEVGALVTPIISAGPLGVASVTM